MNIIYSLDLLGAMVFAISGAMAANRSGMGCIWIYVYGICSYLYYSE